MKAVITVLWILSLVTVVWLFRYEVIGTGSKVPSGYRLDRWTGEVQYYKEVLYGPTALGRE